MPRADIALTAEGVSDEAISRQIITFTYLPKKLGNSADSADTNISGSIRKAAVPALRISEPATGFSERRTSLQGFFQRVAAQTIGDPIRCCPLFKNGDQFIRVVKQRICMLVMFASKP